MLILFRLLWREIPRKPSSRIDCKRAAETMAGTSSTLLYAATFSGPSTIGAVPEDDKEKSHHLKGGKGFRNPWPSYISKTGWEIRRAMLWYAPAVIYS